jgi:hypothetical protein
MISGVHIVISTKDPEADRTFFKDVLEFGISGRGARLADLRPAAG